MKAIIWIMFVYMYIYECSSKSIETWTYLCCAYGFLTCRYEIHMYYFQNILVRVLAVNVCS